MRKLKRPVEIDVSDAINCSLTREFTQVPNKLLRNPEITGKAKALICLLLSNKKGWKSYITTIKQMMKEGEDAIRSGISELEKHGYLLRIRYRDNRTKAWKGSFWAYTDLPWKFNIENQKQALEQVGIEIPEAQLKKMEKPHVENPDVAMPEVEDSGIIIYNGKNTKSNNRIINNSIVSSETTKKGLTRTIKSNPISKPKKRPQPIYKEDNLFDYSNDVQQVFQYWQDQDITVHRKSKARDEALELLNKALHHYKKPELIKSIDTYKKLLDDPYSKLEDRSPFKVGLNRFLKFDSYINTKKISGMENIKSWFEECLKDDLSHLMKQGKDKHPELTKEIKKQYLSKIEDIKITSIDENSFRKTSTLLTEFWNTHLDRFNLHPSENRNVIQFLPIFIEFMKGVSNNGDRYPGLMCYSLSEKSGNKFYNWLKKMNYFRSKEGPFEIKIDHSARAGSFDEIREY